VSSQIHTYTSPPPGDLALPYLQPYIMFRTYYYFPSFPTIYPLFLPTPFSRTPLPVPLSRGGHVCMPTIINGHGLGHVCNQKESFAAFRGRIGWISCQGNLSRLHFHRLHLPLPVFRGSKGPIRKKKLSLQQLKRPLYIHTLLISANAVNMWCMKCIWTSTCMHLWDSAPVCMWMSGFYFYFCISPFLFDSVLTMSVYVSAVWCGGASLSLSFWGVAGMVVG
jgi:hypothetical protein